MEVVVAMEKDKKKQRNTLEKIENTSFVVDILLIPFRLLRQFFRSM